MSERSSCKVPLFFDFMKGILKISNPVKHRNESNRPDLNSYRTSSTKSKIRSNSVWALKNIH
ncbi:hypothetical protein LBBP_00422 [Leptospira borgpetersenii serovar Ballum]|uniref:Uncharacterized protein n=1 Tax=Leptospira borgpetersenii serovar Ballum TaxID=280505 RepID=A0A0S2IME5_LEPBO|nr:hypothetical protein LBBP_00422 [Leptospira borgpetersenii serovar Ballum]